ncbi:MAG: nuclear transport factor 2 family protein [Pseudomonadota bacterium]
MIYTSAQLGDVQNIKDCAIRYCRGVDRLNAELMKSAYWPEATDDHGAFKGNAMDFVEHCMRAHLKWRSTNHCIMNHHIELGADGISASGEIYNITYLFQPGEVMDVWHGRYVDEYAKRGNEWRILHRVCVHEGSYSQPLHAMDIDADAFRQGSFDRQTER